MKQLKTYEGFFDFLKKKTFDTKEDEICYRYGIKNYTINNDGTIDVDGNVDLSMITGDIRMSKLPLKFGNVTGNFDINGNPNFNYLRTMEGCPHTVGGNFYCTGQRLKSLEFCPKIVKGRFDCSNNNIRTFEFFPKSVAQFRCWDNPIEPIWNVISENELFNDEHMDLFEDCSVIQDDGEAVAIERLTFFLDEIGKKINDYEYHKLLRDLVKKGYKIIE